MAGVACAWVWAEDTGTQPSLRLLQVSRRRSHSRHGCMCVRASWRLTGLCVHRYDTGNRRFTKITSRTFSVATDGVCVPPKPRSSRRRLR